MAWPTKKLEEIADIYPGGKSGVTKSDYVESGFPAYSAAGQDGFIKEAYDSGYAIILSSIGSRCGKCFYAEGKWTALANTQVIKVKNPVIAKFLFYYLNDEKKWPKSGTGQPFISPSTVKNFLVPFPPLPIQRKIVKILDTIQSAVEIQEKIIEKTKELKKSLMADLFKYGGPSFRKGRKLKKTEIGKIPEDWEVVEIRKVFNHKVPSIMPRNFPDEQFEYYSIPNFHQLGKPTLVYGRDIGSSKLLVHPGTILFGKLNPRLPKIWLVKNYFDGFRKVATTEFLPLVSAGRIDAVFSFYLLSSNYVLPKTFEMVSGSTTSRQRINPDSFYSILIPLPPLPEQREIAEILQTIDQKIEIEKKKKELYEELFKTMLNKIMNQEIDVEKIKLEDLG